jgi:hypothetical protein
MNSKMGSGAGHILDGIKRKDPKAKIVKDSQSAAGHLEPHSAEIKDEEVVPIKLKTSGNFGKRKASEKICPLTRLVCLKESCQWWTRSMGGRCSVYVTADSLKHWWQIWK